MEKRIDAYVEQASTDYNMYFSYNDVEFNFLSVNPQATSLARSFKTKLPQAENVYTFTDTSGWVTTRENPNSVLSSIKGLNNIENSLHSIISASANLDIQSDLIVHIKNKEFQLVGNVDENYAPSDTLNLSKKGFSLDVLLQLEEEISTLKQKEDAATLIKK